jgi:hypothetical protein
MDSILLAGQLAPAECRFAGRNCIGFPGYRFEGAVRMINICNSETSRAIIER